MCGDRFIWDAIDATPRVLLLLSKSLFHSEERYVGFGNTASREEARLKVHKICLYITAKSKQIGNT